MNDKDYTSTTMRIAGNVAAGLVNHPTWADMCLRRPNEDDTVAAIAIASVAIARAIVAEVQKKGDYA